MKLPIDIDQIKGFLDPDEGQALYQWALKSTTIGPCLEIGSYCGKSSVYLGQACLENNQVLFAVDHHRGSEEHQPGEEYHDPDLYDDKFEVVDSFPLFRSVIDKSGLENTVIPIVAKSTIAAKAWATPLSMVFIDGGHSLEAAMADYECWTTHILKGGILAIHDIFPNPDDGGQAPFAIWKKAIESGLFKEVSLVKTLGFLQRID